MESGGFVAEHVVPVDLGQASGTRKLSIDIDARFDESDDVPVVNDLLQIYLVESDNPSSTVLDRGEPGTALFSLGEDQAEFRQGLVQFDGQTVEIDVSSVEGVSGGDLIFQLLDNDSDDGSQVTIVDVRNELDPDGVAFPALPSSQQVLESGAGFDVSSWALTDRIDVEVSNVRYDSVTRQYIAEMRVENRIENPSRNIVVAFPNLPDGVSLENASGVTSDGAPFVSLKSALDFGGLAPGVRSDAVRLRFANSGDSEIRLVPEVLIGPEKLVAAVSGSR